MTSVIARATHSSELRPVIDAVHDSFFDVEAVRFHEMEGVVEVPYRHELPLPGSPARRLVNWLRRRHREEPGLLRFRKVKAVLLPDDQVVGTYDINAIVFDGTAKKVIVRTGIPTRFELEVEGLDVTVER